MENKGVIFRIVKTEELWPFTTVCTECMRLPDLKVILFRFISQLWILKDLPKWPLASV